MRKLAIAAVATAALLTLTACPDGTHGPSSTPQPAAPPAVGGAAGAKEPKPPHIPAVDKPGPQADPGTCTQGGERDIELYAHWASETDKTPTILWSKNGATQPAGNLVSLKNRPGFIPYSGDWSYLVRGKCHDVLVIKVTGTTSMTFVMCAVVDLGDGPVKTGQRDCTVTYTVV